MPDINFVDPSNVEQGKTYNLYLSTINFDINKMSVSFGEGISVNSFSCDTPYSCNSNISVSQNASVGTRDIIIYYKERPIIATAKLTVMQTQLPDILSINPSTLFQGNSYDLALNTINFDLKSMYLDFGSGINLNNLSCPSRNYCSANVSITNNAQVGIRDVKIIYGNQTIIATAKISIEKEPEPDVLSINPNNLNQGKIYDLSLQVQNFDPYKMSLNFGAGTKINSLTCPSKYSCISNLSISNDAEPGLRDIKIQYKEKTYTATAKITIIAEQPPDVLSSNPSILEKGKSYNVNLNTINFDAKTMKLDFGSGITVSSLNCQSPYVCLSNVSVSSNAQAGIRDIKIITREKTYIATAKITIEEEKLPDVLSANPSNLYQGESYSLILNTINFDQKKMSLNFGEGILSKNLNCPSTSFCNINLEILQDAKTGLRDIKIIYKEKEIVSTAKLNILEEKLPDVLSSNPYELLQGENYVLSLNTINFDQKKMSLNFGEGINLESLNCPSAYNCNAKINLSSNVHPGLRDINIFYKEKRIVATAKLLISEAQEPDILSANPILLKKGKEYTISLNALNFDIKTMQIDIGSGFEIKKFNCINKFNCLLDLKVLSDAKTGKRDIFIFYKNKRKMATAKLEIEKEKEVPTIKPTTPVTVVPEIKCEEKDFSNIFKAPIALLEPKTYSENDYAIIKEGSLFKWDERYQGLAEWFEFKIIWNDKVIWTKKIEPATFKIFNTTVNYLPNFFKVDSGFLNEMASIDWKKITSSPKGGMFLSSVYGVILEWQVAGFRNYPLSCILGDLGPKVEVEVEISNKWKFSFPDKPTGLECENAKTAPKIKIQNLDLEKGHEFGAVGTQNYPEDRIELSGSFDLSMAPYLVDNFFTVPPFSGHSYTTTLSNLIIDWGDGYINFPSVEFKTYGLSIDDAINKTILTIKPIVHKYKNVGKRFIRVFLLSEDDLQDINPAIVASAYDNYSSNPYWQIVSASNFFVSDSSVLELAKRAYMIYCHEIEISPIEDQIANGVLHLESVNISAFNGQGFPQTMMAPKTPSFSNCQVLQADADLKYYGKGNAYQKWSLLFQDAKLPIGGEWFWVGPSKPRENLTRDNFNKVTPDSFDYKPLSSPVIDLEKELGLYGLFLEVNVGLAEALALSQEEYLSAFFNNYFKNETVYYAYLGGNYYLSDSSVGSSQNSYTNVGVQFSVLAPSEETTGLPPFINVEANPYLPEVPKKSRIMFIMVKILILFLHQKTLPVSFYLKQAQGKPLKFMYIIKFKKEEMENILEKVIF